MTASVKAAKKLTDRARKRAELTAKKRAAVKAAADRAEEKAEHGAPKIQREPVLGRNGEILRGERLEISGTTFVRSNPVSNLVARSRKKEPGERTLDKIHSDAALWLINAWEESQGGATMGQSNYGERVSGGSSVGLVADATLAAHHRQMQAEQIVGRVMTGLGPLWSVVHAVVILNIPPEAWGQQAGLSRDKAIGYFCGAMDIVVRIYNPPKETRTFIRSIEMAGMALDKDVGISK